MSETIKIKRKSIDEAIKNLKDTKNQLNNYPGYELKNIFIESQGNSKEEIIKMFQALDDLKSTLILSFESTVRALEVIANDFESFDKTFAQDFKK